MGTDGGRGVGTFRVGADADDNAAGPDDVVEESRGTIGLVPAVTGGGGNVGLLPGTAGEGGVGIITGREDVAMTGVGIGFDTTGGGDAAGLPATGGLTDGNPIMVRLMPARFVVGADTEDAG